MTLQDIYKELKNINSLRQKEIFLLQTLRNAENLNDEHLVAQICDFILNAEFEKFGAQIRSDALMWLTKYIISNLTDKQKREKIDFATSYDLNEVMWKFKWIVSDLANSSAISKQNINKINRAMKGYYEWLNISLSAYHKALMTQNIAMGEVSKAKKNFKLWQELNKDEMSDCPACEVSENIIYLAFIGQYQNAIDLAQPILTGELKCAEVPHTTYAAILFSMINLELFEDAKILLQKGIKTVKQNPRTINQIAYFIEIAIRLNEPNLAIDLAKKHSDTLLDSNDDIAILRLFIATSIFDKHNYQTALNIASEFDARNANSYYTTYLREFYALYSTQK